MSIITNIYNWFSDNFSLFSKNARDKIFTDETFIFVSYLKFSITVYNLCVVIFLWLVIINSLVSAFFENAYYVKRITYYLNWLSVLIITTLLLAKFLVTLKFENIIGSNFNYIRLEFFQEYIKTAPLKQHIAVSTSFGDSVLILMLVIGLICVDLLSAKSLFKDLNNLSKFYLIFIVVTLMVSTHNLLIMFISFDFIFLATVYFAYSLGYTKKSDYSVIILVKWTLFGSFLVLCSLAYLYYKYKTLNYIYLGRKSYSQSEIIIFFFTFVVGFGVKIPLAPFHHWLLKIHVEAPTGFSIFLSGFLVKSAFYCLYILISIFNDNKVYIYLIVWIVISLFISTLGLARQTDIKKLIAWATIQEMTFMVTFLVFKQVFLTSVCVIFFTLHGLMSALMFFIVDILQRRYKTRATKVIKGVNIYFPGLSRYIWFLILLFSGFPFTVKFYVEWSMIMLAIETHTLIAILIVFFINFLSVIFFCKFLFELLYGIPENSNIDLELIDVQNKEKAILSFLGHTCILVLVMMFIV